MNPLLLSCLDFEALGRMHWMGWELVRYSTSSRILFCFRKWMKIPFSYGCEFMTAQCDSRKERNNKLCKYRSRGGVLSFAEVQHGLVCISPVISIANTYTSSLLLFLSAVLSAGMTRTLICIHVVKYELRETRI